MIMHFRGHDLSLRANLLHCKDYIVPVAMLTTQCLGLPHCDLNHVIRYSEKV